MDFEIVPGGDAEYPIFRNLAPFYVYDMAAHAKYPFEADGTLDAGDHFNPYWGRVRAEQPWPSDWHGFPFLLRVNGAPAGFGLVAERGAGHFDMGEFFVGHQHRRSGVGRRFATALFDKFPGQWEVREMLSNVGAQAFWRRIIADYTGGAFTDATERFPQYRDMEFVVQRFRSGA